MEMKLKLKHYFKWLHINFVNLIDNNYVQKVNEMVDIYLYAFEHFQYPKTQIMQYWTKFFS